MQQPTFYWHIHHERLMEAATEPIENRVAYIKANKPASEVGTRLRLLKPVKGDLPVQVVKAGAACVKAWAAYDKAGAAYDEAMAAYGNAGAAYFKARAAYDKAMAAYVKARASYDTALVKHASKIEALHKKECKNCPWNGKTIFP